MSRRAVPVGVLRVEGGRARRVEDRLAGEAPLELRVAAGAEERRLAVTLRTPGDDEELAAGLLLAEGVIRSREDVLAIGPCAGEGGAEAVRVRLRADALPPAARDPRLGVVTAACGACGHPSLEALAARLDPPPAGRLEPALLAELPARLRARQGLFARTGGLHAAALFGPEGEPLCVREDVGRHNAVDKALGRALLAGGVPAGAVLLVSGRAGFEIVQKALAAGVPTLAAVSAPSSLAVALARRFDLTLVGFLRGGRYNVYAGAERLGLEPAARPGG